MDCLVRPAPAGGVLGAWTLPKATGEHDLLAPSGQGADPSPSHYPADLYPGGFPRQPAAVLEQPAHSVAVNGRRPTNGCCTPCFTLDEKGRKIAIPGQWWSIRRDRV